ncbi:hypothetical protein ACFXPS_05620 [Nocardia sp. NPDC059091]|uniref:hypothetical protein n=1 Tax=unclassified Nocardia TaxID=2637762 RepID=UPI0036CD26D8
MSDPRKIDRADMVQALWPGYGPHTAESVISATDAIAELWRYLGHATRSGKTEALADPADVYTMVWNLRTAFYRASQVLDQLHSWAGDLQRNPDLASDQFPRERSAGAAETEWEAGAAGTAWHAAMGLWNAGMDLSPLIGHLDEAAAKLSHLYIDRPVDAEEERS